MSDSQKPDRCPCGGIILADTEDWKVPLCHSCWQDIGEPSFEPKHDRMLLALAKRSEKMWRALAAYESLKQQALAMREALAKTRGAMTYAYDDHSDQYYLNVRDDIDRALEQFDEFMEKMK